jgi:hypothetical protein
MRLKSPSSRDGVFRFRILEDRELHTYEGPVHEWINRKQKMRGQGGIAVLIPLKTYDVIFFIEKITRTTPNPLALKRFGKR